MSFFVPPYLQKTFIMRDFAFTHPVKLLGGAKKKSISKMNDLQANPEQKQEIKKPKAKGKGEFEKKERSIRMPDINDERFLSEISKMSFLTPYSLASQFNLKISLAKDLLEELAKKHVVKSAGGNARVRIYQAAAA
jgi:small subunit ribosomal protein S25e